MSFDVASGRNLVSNSLHCGVRLRVRCQLIILRPPT